ncbi:MAG: YdcF family protein [Deltaproteobacteria bacterium]|nr:YdcF family protein [Deltaproteobacteria bacterium]
MKHTYIFILAGTLVFAVGLFLAYPLLERGLYRGDVPRKADAIIVLSGDAEPYYMRTQKAVELYREGYSRYIIFTGYGTAGDSAEFLSKIAVHYGIPRSAIIIEPYARSTYENFSFSMPMIMKHGFKSILIVTSPYHQLRAYLVAKKVFRGTGIRIYSCASNKPSGIASGIGTSVREARFVIMEYIKLAGYSMLGRI